ncbi:MAG: sortase [Eggerthellaceae bacterium]|nr:sortase [Eggerthellaceae bacterium]
MKLSRKRIDLILIAAGLALTLCGAGMLLSFEQEESLAGENARILLADLQRETAAKGANVAQATVREQTEGLMPQIVVDGYPVAGALSIESIGMSLPILGDWSYDLLQVAPCRYSGTAEGGDLILLGHSYREHFRPLYDVRVGDLVEFCDASGSTYLYKVAQTEVLKRTQLEELTRSGHDLTLFTCTYTGESRFVVKCDFVTQKDSPPLIQQLVKTFSNVKNTLLRV